MNWTDKASEIAQSLAAKRLSKLEGSQHWPIIVNTLMEAAMEGFRYECDNWVLQRR